jgi:hypothetical protein
MEPKESFSFYPKEKTFDEEWMRFEGKEYMDRDEFDLRMKMIEDTQEIDDLDEYQKVEQPLKLFEMDIRRFIDPYHILASRRRDCSLHDHFDPRVGSGSDLKYAGIVQFVLENCPEDKRLIVHKNHTFLVERF